MRLVRNNFAVALIAFLLVGVTAARVFRPRRPPRSHSSHSSHSSRPFRVAPDVPAVPVEEHRVPRAPRTPRHTPRKTPSAEEPATQPRHKERKNTLQAGPPPAGVTVTPATLPAIPPVGTVRVAVLQFAAGFGEVAANTKRLSALIDYAARRGAKIVVMPEAAVPGYMSADLQTAWRDPRRRKNPKDGRDVSAVAEPVPGKTSRFFAATAARLKLYLVVTMIENAPRPASLDVPSPPAGKAQRPARVCFNTALLFGPRGKLLRHHRKIRLWPPGDATWAEKGNLEPRPVQTPYGPVGLMICYDAHLLLPLLAKRGAKILLYPVGWVDDGPPTGWFAERLPSYAAEFGVAVVAANWSVRKKQKNRWGQGHSCIIAADGRVLAAARTTVGDELVLTDLPVQTAKR